MWKFGWINENIGVLEFLSFKFQYKLINFKPKISLNEKLASINTEQN